MAASILVDRRGDGLDVLVVCVDLGRLGLPVINDRNAIVRLRPQGPNADEAEANGDEQCSTVLEHRATSKRTARFCANLLTNVRPKASKGTRELCFAAGGGRWARLRASDSI